MTVYALPCMHNRVCITVYALLCMHNRVCITVYGHMHYRMSNSYVRQDLPQRKLQAATSAV